MRVTQRVIKWFAVALGVMLILGMATALVSVGAVVTEILGVREIDDTEQVSDEWAPETVVSDAEQVRTLLVDVKTVSVEIKAGEKFEMIGDEEWVSFRRDGERVQIGEQEHKWSEAWGAWHEPERRRLVITVPRDAVLVDFELDAGAGLVRIDGLKAENVNLQLGAGRAEITNLTVSGRTKLGGGAGYLSVRDSSLANLDLDLSKTDGDYRLEVTKGVGAVMVNGMSLGDGATYGEGGNLVKINGGVGAIEVFL